MSNYRSWLDSCVNNIGYTIVRLAPIIAPLPALATLLDATDYAIYAWFVVFGVELTGYAIGEQSVKAIRLQVFKIRNLVWALAVYGIVIEGLMLGYKVLPAWAEWYAGRISLSLAIQAGVGVLYPAFTLAGAILFAFHEYLEEVQADRAHAKKAEREQNAYAVEDDRHFEQQRRQIELDAMKAKLAQDAEIEREKALSSIRMKEAKTASQPATSRKRQPAKKQATASDARQIQMRMIPIYQREPDISDIRMAAEIGKSKKTIQDLLADLVAKEVVHVERRGRGKIVTVNGRYEEFAS